MRLPVTRNGPEAAAQVVFAARVPATFCTLESSYQITTAVCCSSTPTASKVSIVTVFRPGFSATPLMLQLRCQGTQDANAPLTFTLYVSVTLAPPLRLIVGEVVWKK